ncbi:MAG: hypothetical protein WD651_04125, partial [Acidimicrobiia bacterium]
GGGGELAESFSNSYAAPSGPSGHLPQRSLRSLGEETGSSLTGRMGPARRLDDKVKSTHPPTADYDLPQAVVAHTCPWTIHRPLSEISDG